VPDSVEQAVPSRGLVTLPSLHKLDVVGFSTSKATGRIPASVVLSLRYVFHRPWTRDRIAACTRQATAQMLAIWRPTLLRGMELQMLEFKSHLDKRIRLFSLFRDFLSGDQDEELCLSILDLPLYIRLGPTQIP